MPFIEDDSLFELHKQLEREQKTGNLLLDQVKSKSKELAQARISKRIYLVTTLLAMLILSGLIGVYYKYPDYIMGDIAVKYLEDSRQKEIVVRENKLLQDSILTMIYRMEEMEERIATTPSEQKNIKRGSFEEDYDDFFANKIVYSVQIGAFKKNNLKLFTPSFLNFKKRKKGDIYMYSLGNFINLEEAQSFKKSIQKMGFKDAFIVKYKNGKRL